MPKTEALCDVEVIHEEVVAAVREQMPTEAEAARLSEFFKVFADGTRAKVLWALDHAEMCVCDIAVLLDMTKSAISHQLRVLREAGLVKTRREGKVVYYSLADSHVADIFEKAVEHLNEI
jgi:ArsR family transcriptional regulator